MEDEDGYMTISPKKLELCTAATPTKETTDCCPFLWWKIGFGISLVGNVALALVIISLCLPVSQDVLPRKLLNHEIRSCTLKCIPCSSDKKSITANLTLDPKTAHPQLYVSDDLKTVKWRDMKQHVTSGPLRYDVMASVISHEGFTSGKNCWEVEVVQGGSWWGVGVIRESANRNGPIFLAPEGGYWAVQRIDGQYQAITNNPRTNLSLCHPPSRIRVSLDYSEGLVAFFDGDTNAHLFTFPKAEFAGEKIHAWLLIYGWNGELIIYP
ncbi:butyrophilin subfamily 1 member A1-like [Rhineura floridana]|uniref:butyrophilin subfamily 1 member A1-like n=1 Tax=Rhineura floridana TaxID=261503 RepID=UPI002AC80F9F|nr:butyrophilin subfamily 1 member A1-like [Rhineura floridana]